MSEEELRKFIESNARAIETLTANVSELTRDRQEMYRLMADVASAQSGLAAAHADFYRRLGQTDQRQGEIVEILKLLSQKVNRDDNPS
jgi:hypothetical protein